MRVLIESFDPNGLAALGICHPTRLSKLLRFEFPILLIV